MKLKLLTILPAKVVSHSSPHERVLFVIMFSVSRLSSLMAVFKLLHKIAILISGLP